MGSLMMLFLGLVDGSVDGFGYGNAGMDEWEVWITHGF